MTVAKEVALPGATWEIQPLRFRARKIMGKIWENHRKFLQIILLNEFNMFLITSESHWKIWDSHLETEVFFGNAGNIIEDMSKMPTTGCRGSLVVSVSHGGYQCSRDLGSSMTEKPSIFLGETPQSGKAPVLWMEAHPT